MIGLFGTHCGGTTYVVKRLRKAGVALGHERVWSAGIVSGRWLVDRAIGGGWDVLGIIARHPLLVAQTHARAGGKRYPAQWATGDPVRDALRYWVTAHTAAAKLDADVVVRIDSHIEEDMAELGELLGTELPPWGAPRSKPNRWPRWSWQRWAREDPDYAEAGRALVDGYGLDEP